MQVQHSGAYPGLSGDSPRGQARRAVPGQHPVRRGEQLLADLPDPAIARYAGGTVIGSALLAATGAGAGSLIRHQTGAIIAVVAWGLVVELVVGATLTATARFLPYTAAAMMAGDTNGGGMPQIPRGVTALPYPAATGVLTTIAISAAAIAALTTVRRDINSQSGVARRETSTLIFPGWRPR